MSSTPLCEAASISSTSTCRLSIDRKSTRLNSSHQIISYAVFCLKKKRELQERPAERPGGGGVVGAISRGGRGGGGCDLLEFTGAGCLHCAIWRDRVVRGGDSRV